MLDKKQSAMEKGAEKIVEKITERQSSFSFDIKYHETKKMDRKKLCRADSTSDKDTKRSDKTSH